MIGAGGYTRWCIWEHSATVHDLYAARCRREAEEIVGDAIAGRRDGLFDEVCLACAGPAGGLKDGVLLDGGIEIRHVGSVVLAMMDQQGFL